ncbi:hypothetical protein D3C84_599730 [compost metagenome]
MEERFILAARDGRHSIYLAAKGLCGISADPGHLGNTGGEGLIHPLDLRLKHRCFLRQGLISRGSGHLLIGDLSPDLCILCIKLSCQLLDCPGLRLLLVRKRALLLENDTASFPVLSVTLITGKRTFNLADGTDTYLRLHLVLALAERLFIADHHTLQFGNAGGVLSDLHINGADPLTKRLVGIG